MAQIRSSLEQVLPLIGSTCRARVQVKRLQSRLEAAEAGQMQNGMASSTEQEHIAALKSNIADLEKVTAARHQSQASLCVCT